MNDNVYEDAVFNTKGTKVTQRSHRKLFEQEVREGTEKPAFESVFSVSSAPSCFNSFVSLIRTLCTLCVLCVLGGKKEFSESTFQKNE
jgi:hypothetical protein